MSHYPSTAELAAFRRAVPRLAPFPSAPVHRNGLTGSRMTALTVVTPGGRLMRGRYGSDWSQCVVVRGGM